MRFAKLGSVLIFGIALVIGGFVSFQGMAPHFKGAEFWLWLLGGIVAVAIGLLLVAYCYSYSFKDPSEFQHITVSQNGRM